MLKIAVMGGRETVMGFKALGLDVFPISGKDEAKAVFHDLVKDGSDYAIIYLEENLYQDLSHEVEKCKDNPVPAVILIPGKDGSLGLGKSALQSAVERAVGSNIL